MNMTLPQALFLLIALALFVYVVRNERRVTSKVPLLVRYVAGILALLALLGFLFPVKYPISRGSQGQSNELAVLTRGTPVGSIRAAAQDNHTVTTDSAISRRYGVPLIRDWAAFADQHPAAALAVHGFGLTPRQRNALSTQSLRYHRPQPPQGIVFCDWPQQLQASTPLTVQGRYHNPSDRKVKIVLLSASQAVDSATVAPQGIHPFALSYQPKQVGNNLFALAAIDGPDTVQVEQVPVSIEPAQTLAVVLLAASPSFEYKFISGWFQQLHYGTALRTRIATGKFSTAYSEHMQTSLASPLRDATFKDIDLLIADETELAALSSHEQQAVSNAVQSGMGLLLFMDGAANRSLPGREFRLLAASGNQEQAVVLRSINQQTYPELRIAALSGIQSMPAQQPLLYAGDRLVAASQGYGKGRITATTIHNSYSWWLRNQQEAYAQFWSFLVDNTTSGHQQGRLDMQLSRFPTAHTWMDVLVQQRADTLLAIDGQPYPALQHEQLPDFVQLSFWPSAAGWHSVKASPADSTWFYVYGQTDWLPAKDFDNMQEMDDFYRRYGEDRTLNTSKEAETPKELVPKWVFFLIFLAASGTLWYASRHYNQNVI
ncbi:hypothetical protein [Parapedobacter sp. DT-150]|uniref:hypothetical protein n=1 Tax=Parapedobacter sp. DT-150 TaxID=3396162 RepID=UPI003F1BAAF6